MILKLYSMPAAAAKLGYSLPFMNRICQRAFCSGRPFLVLKDENAKYFIEETSLHRYIDTCPDFNPYEIASYAEGLLMATILFREQPEPEYRETPEVPDVLTGFPGQEQEPAYDIAEAEEDAYTGRRTEVRREIELEDPSLLEAFRKADEALARSRRQKPLLLKSVRLR